MPTLTWIGKEKVVNHHHEVPYRVLKHKYGFRADDSADTTPTNNGNKIIHGDNLEALKSLLPEYEGRIKCIYIDPPYNTGNEKWVYNDNVNDPKIKKWLGEVVGKQGEDLSRHDKWLCMMYPRLKLLHKLLADDGVIFISIDVFEFATLKLILDEIFGSSNFRNCIAVRRGIKNVQAQFEDVQTLSLGHEYIFLYSKDPTYRLPKLAKIHDTSKPGKWDTFWRGTDRPTMRYTLFGQTPDHGQWRWEATRGKQAVKNYEKYLSEYSKKADCWALCDLFSFNVKGKENSFLNLSKRLIYSDLPFERRIGYRILFRFIDTNLPFIFDAVNGSFNEKEYYVNMIIAWLLCECFIKQKKETTDFILKNRLNDFVKNKFIQKCRESYRVSELDKEFLLSLKKQSQ